MPDERNDLSDAALEELAIAAGHFYGTVDSGRVPFKDVMAMLREVRARAANKVRAAHDHAVSKQRMIATTPKAIHEEAMREAVICALEQLANDIEGKS